MTDNAAETPVLIQDVPKATKGYVHALPEAGVVIMSTEDWEAVQRAVRPLLAHIGTHLSVEDKIALASLRVQDWAYVDE